MCFRVTARSGSSRIRSTAGLGGRWGRSRAARSSAATPTENRIRMGLHPGEAPEILERMVGIMLSGMTKIARVLVPVVGIALVAMGGDRPRINFGDPLPGLTAEQRALFLAGKASFEEEGEIDSGLGPVMTGTSCVECHASPAVGGGGELVETRIGAWIDGRFDSLIRFGGP